MESATKTFGRQWLGILPENWRQERAKLIFKERKEKSLTEDIHLTPSQKHGVLPQSDYMKLSGGRVVLNLAGADNMKHVHKGDFIVHLRSFQGGIEYSNFEGKVSNAYTVLKPLNDINHNFYRYVLKSYGFISELSRTTDQLRDGQSIKFSQLDLINFPVPEEYVQEKIANFLDTETAKIDTLITKQERLLQLLEEKRRATITSAVTRGLNPNAELTESRNAWIPLIPQAWSVVTLRHHAIVETGGTPSRDNPSYWIDGTIPWMSSGEVNLRRVGATKEFITTLASESTNAKLLPKGTVMMALNGQGKTKGMVAVLEISAACNQSLVGIKCTRVLNPYFLYYYLFSRYKDIRGLVGDHRDGLNMEHVRSLSIPLAPIEEQEKIVEYLKLHEKRAGEIEEKIQTQISLLRERRTSLISHAVTGKVKIT